MLPPYLALRSSGKGDAVDARKHLAGIMQNRDPMRGAMPMLGLYFAYQFFDLQDVRSLQSNPHMHTPSAQFTICLDLNTRDPLLPWAGAS